MKLIEQIYFNHLIRKIAIIGPFSREQVSFKEKFRITESIDMIRATEKIVNSFIERSGEKPEKYKVEVQSSEPLLFADDYDWYEAIAQGVIQSSEENFPFTVNLTEGEIWTITLDTPSLKVEGYSTTSPSYIQSPVREIVERYRKKKYLEDKPAKPFTKKPTLRTEELLGFPIFKERSK